MAKENNKSLFWTSYSDLMTSLFFILLVLFVVTVVAMGRFLKDANTAQTEINKVRDSLKIANELQIATQNEINKIRDIENSIQNINRTWFEYNEKYKKHVLKIDVSFPRGKSDISLIPLEKRDELYSAGLAIEKFLRHAENEYGESVKYLLIIEGQASNDGYIGNFDLSYQRALSLYRFFKDNLLHLMRNNCEVLVCGSGTEGVLRAYPDNATNTNNQRFLIHILPKPGIIN